MVSATKAVDRVRTGRGLKVFVSYAHRDERLREEVEKHLSPLRRSRMIATWCDQRITPGAEIDEEIVDSLTTSDLILLLVSPDFMNSDYCYLREMHCALKRHRAGQAKVIPIILRPVDWNRTPIGKLLALPRDGKPVTSWKKRDEALLDVAKGVRRAIEEMDVAGLSKFSARTKIRSLRTPASV